MMANNIKLVVYDLDRTLWTITNGIHASLCRHPFIAISENILIDSVENRLELLPNIREVLLELKKRGKLISIISANDFPMCKEILQKLGLFDYFIYPHIEWEDRSLGTCDKKKLMIQLVNKINTIGSQAISYDEVLFIDDRIQNIDVIKKLGIHSLHFGMDIKDHADIFRIGFEL